MTIEAIADVQARIAAIQTRFTEATGSTGAQATRTSAASSTPSWTSPASGTSFADVLAGLQGDSATNLLGGGASNPLSSLGTSALSGLSGMSGAGVDQYGSSQGTSGAQNFVATALSQAGKQYVFGASASPTDANPTAFDCSELVQWAAQRNGVELPRTAGQQYATLAAHGDAMSVDEALRTPGALLFNFATTPTVGGAEPARAHVAISLGDGRTIEARGRAYGVGVFDAAKRFTYAARVPGLT